MKSPDEHYLLKLIINQLREELIAVCMGIDPYQLSDSKREALASTFLSQNTYLEEITDKDDNDSPILTLKSYIRRSMDDLTPEEQRRYHVATITFHIYEPDDLAAPHPDPSYSGNYQVEITKKPGDDWAEWVLDNQLEEDFYSTDDP